MNNKYMTNCKTCGREVAKSARRCPHCGACMPAHKPSFIIWVLVLFAVGIVLYTIGQGMMYGY